LISSRFFVLKGKSVVFLSNFIKNKATEPLANLRGVIMKFLSTSSILLLLLVGLVSVNCSTSKNATSHSNQQHRETSETGNNQHMTLTDHLRRLNGVMVRGYGGSATITIRGAKTLDGSSSSPLFVLDGQRIGHNYGQVYSMVDHTSIVSVEVLKGTRAAEYGMGADFGVILIKTSR
jgi:outer membrane receptor for ferrienterochelin and colicin